MHRLHPVQSIRMCLMRVFNVSIRMRVLNESLRMKVFHERIRKHPSVQNVLNESIRMCLMRGPDDCRGGGAASDSAGGDLT